MDETQLSGWGRLAAPGRERCSEDLVGLSRQVPLFRGLGRAYGDAALPPYSVGLVGGTHRADRLLDFDPGTGVLRAEAGLSLAALKRVFLPRGWFVPVSPGTQYVTLGGMVAADIHGKNHHVAGTIGNFVESLRMRLGDGRLLTTSRDQEPALFAATLGGMGLTGHILEVRLRLERVPSPWLVVESSRRPDLASLVRGLNEARSRWPFSVGWIDCLTRGRGLGRGILMCGRWAEPGEAPRRKPPVKRRLEVPDIFPSWVLDRWSIRLFNLLYYHKHLRRKRRGLADPDSFFYPLDALRCWNRMYGPRGFIQYQCVLPDRAPDGAMRRFLERLTGLGAPCFLAVIKDCGPEGEGLLSFPRPGLSIAVDIAVRDDTQRVVDRLNELVIAEGGRIYLAKDALTRPEHFAAMEPRLARFQALRRRYDPEGNLRSALSVRLLGDAP